MADPPADPGLRYPQLLRDGRWRWWRSLLGLLVAGGVLVAGILTLAAATYVLAAAMGETEDGNVPASDTVAGLAGLNLSIAALIPASVLAVLVAHRKRPGLLASVVGRLRWALLGRLLAAAVPVVALFFAASFLVPSSGTSTDVDVPETATVVGLLAVIVLTTPLQAAAEEVGFRGYLSQTVASAFSGARRGAVVAGMVSAVLFALAHGVQDAWLFGDRLAFGLVASWLAWRTGGLEAPIALHVVNNVVGLGYGALTGTIEASLTASSLEWQFAVVDVAMMVAFAVVVDRLASRWQLATHRAVEVPEAPASALAGPDGVGYPDRRSSTSPPAGDGNPWGMG